TRSKRDCSSDVCSSDYQHLHNHHLHLVAPPGSGNTVLDLEVMLRVNRPTLIVAPTLAIRNQWIQRFMELFLQTNEEVAWISSDIHNPKFVTVTTYNALHTVWSQEETSNERKKKKRKVQQSNYTQLKNHPFGM